MWKMGLVDKMRKRCYSWIKDFNMIQNWDKIIVAISWWKDSLAMLNMLYQLQSYSDLKFELIAVYVIPEIPQIKVLSDQLISIFEQYPVKYIIQKMAIPEWSMLRKWIDDADTCQWCSYTRRISLFKLAETIWATKIAYWHHMDDMIDTLFMNVYKGMRLDIMLPVNKMKKWDFSIIRPMVYLREENIVRYCGKLWIQPLYADCIVSKKSHREKIRVIIDELDMKMPGFTEKMFFAYKSKILDMMK